MSGPRLKHFGWGREGESATAEEEAFARARIAQRFGMEPSEGAAPPALAAPVQRRAVKTHRKHSFRG